MVSQLNKQITRNSSAGTRLYQTKHGNWITQRNAVAGERVKTNPTFSLSRQSAKEFGLASSTGKLIRQAFFHCCRPFYDSGLGNRLMPVLLKIIQGDTINARGRRTVINGSLNMLQGFQFNPNQKLDDARRALFTVKKSHSNKQLYVCIPPFVPLKALQPPGKITHFRLFTACAAINLKNGSFETDGQFTDLLSFSTEIIPATTLVNKTASGKYCINLLAVGIEYYVRSRGKILLYKSGSVNSFSIIKAFRINH